jgi:hypothetical protein
MSTKNQDPENKQPFNSNQEIITTLEETIQNLQLVLKKINESENIYLQQKEVITNFRNSSNNLLSSLDEGKFAELTTKDDDWLDFEDKPPSQVQKKYQKKSKTFNFKLIIFVLAIIVIIVGIVWTIFKPNLQAPQNEEQPPKIELNQENPQNNNDISTEDLFIIPDQGNEDNLFIIPDPEKEIKQPKNSPAIEETKKQKNRETDTRENEIRQDTIAEPTVTPLTIEQSLIANIEKEINQITQKYGEQLIVNIRANFSQNYLLVTLSDDWYRTDSNKQDSLVEEIFEKAKKLDFYKFSFQDNQGNLLARNAFIGDKIIITQR